MKSSRINTLVLIAALVARTAHGQALPDGRTVLARYAQATNAAKVATLAGYSVKGSIEFAAMGLSGTVEGYVARDGRSIQIITLGSFGQVRTGVDSTFGWSIDPNQGPRLIEGQELVETRERSDPRAMRRDPSLIVDAQTLERATIDSQPCLKLKVKWKSGRTTTECYSEKTGLLLSADDTQTSAMGPITVTTTYGDYKVVEGMTVATRTVQHLAGSEVVIKLSDISFGPVDPAKFTLPAEIAALRKK